MAFGDGDKKKKKKKIDPTKMEDGLTLLGFDPETMLQSMQGAEDVYTKAYGQPTVFTPEDAQKLAVLSGEVKKLQPIQPPEAPGNAIPGNEYSYSTKGFNQGLENLAAALLNKEQRNKLYGNREKVKKHTRRAAQKLDKAKRLESLANDMEAAGTNMGATDNSAISEIRDDAQALRDKAQQDLDAADKAKGVYMKAKALEDKKKRAEQDRNFRNQFVSTLGREGYQQTQLNNREQMREKGKTAREKITQKYETQRNEDELKYGLEKARVNANAKIKTSDNANKDSDWPSYAQPDYVKEFVPLYMKAQNKRINQLEDQIFLDNGDVNKAVPEETKTEYKNLKFIQGVARQLELNATSFGELQKEGMNAKQLPETHAPADSQRAILVKMQQLDMPDEMITAYKFYNRISLNKAPQGPENPDNNQSDMGNPGRAFQTYQNGEMLQYGQNDNSNSGNR